MTCVTRMCAGKTTIKLPHQKSSGKERTWEITNRRFLALHGYGMREGIKCWKARFGAEGGTRTPTVLRPSAPQAGASANSATSAWEGSSC